MSDAQGEAEEMPPVPGVLRLGWLLFMQPLTLRRLFKAWGIERTSSMWTLRRQLFKSRHVRGIVLRLTTLLLAGGALVGVAMASGFLIIGFPIDWRRVVLGATAGAMTGVMGGIVIGLAPAVAFGAFLSVAFGAPDGLIKAAVVGVAIGVAFGATTSFLLGEPTGRVTILMYGVACGLVARVAYGGQAGDIVGLTAILTLLPGPLYFMEAPIVLASRLIQRLRPQAAPSLAKSLPHRWHDIIRWPLPGLRGFLIALADTHPTLTADLISEANETFGQQNPARAALHELQARALERAARDTDWRRARDFDLPFLPPLTDLPPTNPLRRYAEAADNILAANVGGDQRRRRQLLAQAHKQVEGLGTAAISAGNPRAPRLLQVNRIWLDAIAREKSRLEAEVAASPELPKVYITGPALDPRDPDAVQIFRARRDLIEVIDHDLAENRRAALMLVGQRRMGKTSLLRMLPAHLGNRTIIATLDFQGLSGSPHRDAPHRWVAYAMRDTIFDAMNGTSLPPIPEADTWGATLDWMACVEAILDEHGRRALVAIDEVERVQTGIDEGWSSPIFLDFARAAGDRLRHIRLLLVSAHPPARLGPLWADRLISAVTRDLGPLPVADAAGLLRCPVDDFPPEVFDDIAVEAVLEQTGGHPFLIQLVGDAVVARLNGDKRREATPRDIRRALDGALSRAGQSLFPDLWRVLEPTQQALLRALADGETPGIDSAAFRNLRDLHYVVERAADDGPEAAFAFPLFGRWIRDHAPD